MLTPPATGRQAATANSIRLICKVHLHRIRCKNQFYVAPLVILVCGQIVSILPTANDCAPRRIESALHSRARAAFRVSVLIGAQ